MLTIMYQFLFSAHKRFFFLFYSKFFSAFKFFQHCSCLSQVLKLVFILFYTLFLIYLDSYLTFSHSLHTFIDFYINTIPCVVTSTLMNGFLNFIFRKYFIYLAEKTKSVMSEKHVISLSLIFL